MATLRLHLERGNKKLTSSGLLEKPRVEVFEAAHPLDLLQDLDGLVLAPQNFHGHTVHLDDVPRLEILPRIVNDTSTSSLLVALLLLHSEVVLQLGLLQELVAKARGRVAGDFIDADLLVTEVVREDEPPVSVGDVHRLAPVRNELGFEFQIQVAELEKLDVILLRRARVNGQARPDGVLLRTDVVDIVMEELANAKPGHVLQRLKLVNVRFVVEDPLLPVVARLDHFR